MGRLIYSTIASLDGFVADETGNFDWAAPTTEVHAFVNDLERGVGTYLYGRKMYETMVYWETASSDDPAETVGRDYAEIWRAADKIVFSTTLDAPNSARTRIERSFEPDAIRALKDAAERDITIGGPHLAALGLRAGLVDELQVFAVPFVVGGGNASLPAGFRTKLELADEHRFADGTVYLNYRVIPSTD
jgi:dihydrofolate reductase